MKRQRTNVSATDLQARKQASHDAAILERASLGGVGLSAQQTDEAKSITQERLKELNKVVMLPTVGGAEAEFILVTIKHADIKSKTRVAPENERVQELLTPYKLRSLQKDIRSDGQRQAAIGQYDEDGIIMTIDGSCRRECCIQEGLDYKIYVTKENLSPEARRAMSTSTNSYVPLSLYEKALKWRFMIDENIYDKPASLAKGEHVDAPELSRALSMLTVPLEVLGCFADVNALGRPTIDKLIKLIPVISAKELIEKIEFIKEIPLKELIESAIDSQSRNVNKVVLDLLLDGTELDEGHKERNRKKVDATKIKMKGQAVAYVSMNKKGKITVEPTHIRSEKRKELHDAIVALIEGFNQ